MKILAIETSTAVGSIAVAVDGKIVASESSPNPKTHSEFVNPCIERLLQSAGLKLTDIDVYAVGSGPGSFTGLRVAGNIAKTFAMIHVKPMVEVTSLQLLKEAAILNGENAANILCLLNAHKNMLYTAAFFDESVLEIQALTVPQIEAMLSQIQGQVLCLGEGYKIYENQFSAAVKSKLYFPKVPVEFPSAEVLAIKAADHFKMGQTIEWKSYKPLYIRASEAEEKNR